MKILHIIKDLNYPGGAERIVCDLVNNGTNNYLVYYGKNPNIFFKINNDKVFYRRGILRLILFLIFNYKKFFYFHLHLFPSIYLTLIFNKKCIIHEHNTHNRRRNIPFFFLIEKYIYKRAVLLIAISNAVKNSLQKWLPIKLNVKTLNNYAPKPLVSEKFNLNYEQEKNQISLVMVASFTKQKRHDFLLNIFKYLPDNFYLYLVGNGPYIEEVKSQAQKLSLSKRISFVGETLYVGDFYRKSDLNILLSHWEGFGLTPFEAAYFGTPSLVSNVEGLAGNAVDPRFIVKSENHKEVAKQIQRLIKIGNTLEIKKKLKVLTLNNSFDTYQEKLLYIYENQP